MVLSSVWNLVQPAGARHPKWRQGEQEEELGGEGGSEKKAEGKEYEDGMGVGAGRKNNKEKNVRK
jgi:hypothetical protein